MKIVILAHWFPPVNSSGAKRFQYISKFLADAGHEVVVITTTKTGADGEFNEPMPTGMEVIELAGWGRARASRQGSGQFMPMYAENPSPMRRLKNLVHGLFGQIPDPRIPFALGFAMPWLDKRAVAALRDADAVMGTCPPWTMLLALVVIKRRFARKVIFDYRDQFSGNNEMPGSKIAKYLERKIDRYICRKADRIVTISEPMREYYEQFHPSVTTIYNGYDETIFESQMKIHGWAPGENFSPKTFRYLGLVSPRCIPHRTIDALVAMERDHPEKLANIRFQFYGEYKLMLNHLEENFPALLKHFEFYPQQAHREAVRIMLEADYLFFCDTSDIQNLSSRGLLNTKVFEYVASGRPILAEIAPDTLGGSIIAESGSQHEVTTSSDDILAFLVSASAAMPPPSAQSPVAARLTRRRSGESYEDLLLRLGE